MYKLMNKIGYVSVEIVVIASIIIIGGLIGVTKYSSKGKETTIKTNETISKVYKDYGNIDLSTTGSSNKNNNENISNKTSELVEGNEFNKKIPPQTRKVIFTDIEKPSDKEIIEVDNDKDNGVIAWINNDTMYVSSQIKNKKIIANKDMSHMFYGNPKNGNKTDITQRISSIIGLENIDMSNCVTAKAMFNDVGMMTTSFEIKGLSNWDVSNIKNMDYMFVNLGSNATKVIMDDISNWNTKNVTSMNYFMHHAGLSYNDFRMDLSKWNVENVKTHYSFNEDVESKVIAPKFN